MLSSMPRLVAFFDGPTQVFCAVLYAVWMVYADGSRSSSPFKVGITKDKDFIPGKHMFVSNIVSARACVTPLKIGLTIPRSKMSRLVLALWLRYKVAKVFPEPVGSISTLGDSTCVISANDKMLSPSTPSCTPEYLSVSVLGTQQPSLQLLRRLNTSNLPTTLLIYAQEGTVSSQSVGPGHCGNKGQNGF